MTEQAVELLDLPDELLLKILKKLRNVHVMYSLEGVHERLDAMAVSVNNSQHINLAKGFFYDDVSSIFDQILDRFCSHILFRICHNIRGFTVETSIMERVLLACKYPELYILYITDFSPKITLHYFTGIDKK
jgi:hypothetical protein